MNTTRKFINSSQIAERWNLKCAANVADYALEKSEVKQHLMKFMFPVQFTIAIAGNLLTLAVLLSGTSNRANRLLTCLAVCDCLMFIMMIADSVITFETFYVIPAVRIFYFEYREYVAFFTNWFAAASVWFVLAISVERLLIIKFPFRSLNSNQNRQVVIIGCLIMLMTFCASQAMRFTNFCFWMESCNGTEIRGACQPATTASDMNHVPEYLAAIAPTWLIFNSFVVVIVPVAIVITINISLLRIVKRSNKQELVRSASTARPRRSDEQEKSMTRAIVAIVTCFSMTQGPSGLLYLAINLGLATSWLSEQTQKSLQELTVYTNMLVLTGKMLNFVLFCLTSATFRVRLLNTMTIWCYKLGLVQRPVLNRDASRTLLTAKSSVASYHWRGRNGQDDSIPMRNGHKKNSASSMGNNNCAARVNNNNTQRSSGSRSSEDSATGNSRPLFMTNHSLEKEQFVESTEM